MSNYRRKSNLKSSPSAESKATVHDNTRPRRSSGELDLRKQSGSRVIKAKTAAHGPSTPVSARAPSLKLPIELFRAGWTSLDEEWWPGNEALGVSRNR